MEPTAAQINLLRSQPHRTDLYLSIYRPKTLFACQVNGTFSIGDTSITWDNTVTGSYSNVYADMTVKIGYQQNSDDVGRLRVRSIDGTTVTFAENSINWSDNLYLTFIDIVSVEAIYPKIIQDPNDAENVIFYKDGDIAYSNQNSIYGTFPCAGPHRAGFIETGTATFYYTATGTYNAKGDSLTYLWAFEGGTPTGSTALTPGNVTYNSCGHNKTKLVVTSSSGAEDTTYRYVSIYTKPGEGTCVPVLKWEFTDPPSGSRAEGGYTASIRVRERLDEIEPNALVVVFADEWYGGTRVSIGGNAPGNQKIVFVGYILKDTIKFNYKDNYAEFQIGSISQVMKESEGFAVSCESKTAATTWFQLEDMTVAKAMYHYLRWHSTILKVCDFQYTGDDRYVQYFDTDRSSLFDAINTFLQDGLLGELNSDMQGKLWGEISSFGLETPLTSIRTNPFVFDKQDWLGTPVVEERRNAVMSLIELGGIVYYGATLGTWLAILSNAPSMAPLYHGKGDRKDGLILLSQEQLNRVAGNYLAHHNSKHPEISMSAVGNYRHLDIAPQEKFYFVIDSNDTGGRNIQGIPYRIASIDWDYRSVSESFRPNVTFQQIATGSIGVSVPVLLEPPDAGFSYPGLGGFNIPPYPTFPISTSTSLSAVTTQVLMHDTTYGLLYTSNFDSATPNWITVNAGLTATQYASISWIGICPNGAVYVAYTPEAGSGSFLARAASIGGVFTVLYDQDAEPTKAIWGAGLDMTSQERIGFIWGAASANSFYTGANGSYSIKLAINDNKLRNNGISFGDDRWLLTYYNEYSVLSSAGTSVVDSGAATIVRAHLRAGTVGYTYHDYNGASDILYRGEDNMDNVVQAATGQTTLVGPRLLTMAADPTGQYLMGRALAGQKARSSDFGATWLALSNLEVSSGWFFANAGDSNRWVAARSVVRYTTNFGTTWANKNGDLTSSVPFPSIDIIKVVGVA